MSAKLLSVFVTVAIFAIAECGSQHYVVNRVNKLKVSLYMSSLDGESKAFINTVFKDVYSKISDYLDVEYIPWGKTERVDGVRICKDEKDCIGNQVHSCAWEFLADKPSKQVEYMRCEYETSAATTGYYKCVGDAGLDIMEVNRCYETKQGDLLQAEAEKKTKAIKLTNLPTIVYDDAFDQETSNDAVRDFQSVTCKKLEKNVPSACNVFPPPSVD